jgi:hypothetical protein
MESVLRRRVTIQPGGKIELWLPELPVGMEVEVIVFVQDTDKRDLSPVDLIGSAKEANAIADATRRIAESS